MRLAGLFVALLSSNALADKCEMKGQWVEEKDSFSFTADYTEKKDADKFSGTYTNPGAGATANVGGALSKGKWSIQFIYTSEKQRGLVANLTGEGARDPKTNAITIKGKYEKTQNGKPTKSGTFVLDGKCKK
jgi:hypothetical protein